MGYAKMQDREWEDGQPVTGPVAEGTIIADRRGNRFTVREFSGRVVMDTAGGLRLTVADSARWVPFCTSRSARIVRAPFSEGGPARIALAIVGAASGQHNTGVAQ